MSLIGKERNRKLEARSWELGEKTDRSTDKLPAPSSQLPASIRAFSLIEMMVVLAIIALVVGMSLPYFGRFTSGSSIKAAARKIASLLYTGRSFAITHRKPYAVVFDASGGEVTIQDAATSEVVEKRFHLPSSVFFEHPKGEDPVGFKDDRVIFTTTGGVSGETGTLWLRDKKENTLSITVHQSTGRVKVEKLELDN